MNTVKVWSVVRLPEGVVLSGPYPLVHKRHAETLIAVGAGAVTVNVWLDGLLPYGAVKTMDDLLTVTGTKGCIADTSARPILLGPLSVNQMLPSGPSVMPDGKEFPPD